MSLWSNPWTYAAITGGVVGVLIGASIARRSWEWSKLYEPMPDFDLEQFSGSWYEMFRYEGFDWINPCA